MGYIELWTPEGEVFTGSDIVPFIIERVTFQTCAQGLAAVYRCGAGWVAVRGRKRIFYIYSRSTLCIVPAVITIILGLIVPPLWPASTGHCPGPATNGNRNVSLG